jgi:phosphomannomutase
MLAATGAGLSSLKDELFKRYGRVVGGQRDVALTPERGKKLKALIQNPPLRLGRRKVSGCEAIEGLKLDFGDEAWVLLRQSGTEPLVRCYAEAPNVRELNDLLRGATEAVQ